MPFTFDWTVSGGSIINAIALLVGFVVAFARIGGRIDLLVLRTENLEKALQKSEGVNIRLVSLEERVTNHVTMIVQFQKDIADSRNQFSKDVAELRGLIHELRRGEGWITQRRSSLDGEYSP